VPRAIWTSGPAAVMATWSSFERGRLGRNDAQPTRKLSEIDDSAPKRRAASACPSSWTRVKIATAMTSRTANPGF
jgi:hypothetical protein